MTDLDVGTDVTAFDPLDGLSVPAGRREIRAVLLRAVASDHGIGVGLTLPQLVAYACTHGLRTESERAQQIADTLAG